MKKVTIFGSVGFNIGDEAIAVATANKLLEHNPDWEITISTIKEQVINGKYENLKEFNINRNSFSGWRKLYKQIAKSDLILLGGGTMIQDKLGISLMRGMIPYMVQILFISKILNKKVITLPIGVDKLNTSLGKRMAPLFLRSVDQLFVRDANSLKYAELYTKKANIGEISADPAFFLDLKSDAFKSSEKKESYITISLVNENLNKNTFLPAVSKGIDWILNETDYSIHLIAMDRREIEELTLFQELINGIDSKFINRIQIFDINSDVYHVTQELRNSKLLIGMRLHALILSVGYTSLIGLSRTTKTENFLEEFKIDYFDLNKGEIDSNKLIRLIESKIKNELDREDQDNTLEILKEKKDKYQEFVDVISKI
ncbi:hypothetical protein BACSP_00833 [Bacillus sp. T2.9-1]|uniref:polysaccharide pyruvyl transferase family protein n=1 Tax=Bacillus sp. T2.9-1 TaxID=3041163 RepID=UPI002477C5E6|nr:polysaccharide pyruvyl transferase family protein [Bacillus sp. T2.9-1]CAI9395043.1 hypothetical protein BACSP_00833 [Bacillus sp. T2.9-1]